MISPSYSTKETTLVGPFENEETQAVLRIISDPEKCNFDDRGELVAALVDFLSASIPARALKESIEILSGRFEHLESTSAEYARVYGKVSRFDEIGANIIDACLIEDAENEFTSLQIVQTAHDCAICDLQILIAKDDGALNRELAEASI